MKISILLPYKENFSSNYAGAVSLFVGDTSKNSIYKKNITVYGNTEYKNLLSKNYVNIKLTKKILKSNSKIFVNEFINNEKKNPSDIIEIHNRPNYVKFIKNTTKSKITLFFHNDPLQMNGSSSLEERLYLLNNVDCIIFNSNWSKNRFLINVDIPQNKFNFHVIYQSASKVKINFNNKKNIISFVGKLNTAKGYDLFGKAILKILNKFPEWRSVVFGDEPREKLFFKHKNLNIMGFKSHKYILKYLENVSISVICSRWEEPFGRTSLEAASRGSAIIISNRGGLPETTNHAIKIDNLNADSVYNSIETLILNKNKRISYQKKTYSDFKYTHKYISNKIDLLRKSLINKNNILFTRNKFRSLKIMHITNFNEKHNGRLQYNTGRRINNGFIRLGHNVLQVSDRDILANSKNISDIKGSKSLNNKILENEKNFKPDILVLGHADSVTKSTLVNLRERNPNLKICQWFLDPVSKFGPDYSKNKNRVLDKSDIIDATFLTTDPKSLSFKINNSFFMPNPADKSFETLENYNFDCPYDVFFAMSHGVHRGELKTGKTDNRELIINKILEKEASIKFDIYGMKNIQPIWGNNFIEKISQSKMGLNLSRGEPLKYYSSDRIVQLMGNGLLTFIDNKTMYSDFFNKKELITYSNINDLTEKILKYKKDDKLRKLIAKNGKNKYLKYFNSDLVADYILCKTLNIKSKNKFIWL
ncbi:glycosyltransferase [Candidatus Pelagibacter sp.]|nr:glycosyltransferase [Candidatus Pelagibacter sp.]